MRALRKLGRPDELRECTHPGCTKRGFMRFCKEHHLQDADIQESWGLKKIDRDNITPRSNPATTKKEQAS
jgi:hypothetical protein